MTKSKKYTREFLEPLVKESKSVAEVARKIDPHGRGGTHSHLHRVIKKLDLNTSHFTGQGWRRGKKFPPQRPLSDYTSNRVKIKSNSLKKRLIQEKVFKHQCNRCRSTKWEGNLIPLDLHHKDHNPSNNNLSNLELLCPNCHRITHSLARDRQSDSASIKSSEGKTPKNKTNKTTEPKNNCKKCNKATDNPHYCSYECSREASRKVSRPSYKILIEELENSNYSAVGRKYGVSDNAVRKWVKTYESEKGSPN